MTHSSPPASAKLIGCIPSLNLDGLDQLASKLFEHLPGGITFGLVGTLGAGKTTLVQAIARAAKIDASEVTSPTFTLLQSHRFQSRQGKATLHHLDTYRLADEDEFLELGVDELFDEEEAWTLVEWAERFPSVMPPNTLWLYIDLIEDAGEQDDTRQIRFFCSDAGISDTVSDLINQLSV